jgi:hypothetical protein
MSSTVVGRIVVYNPPCHPYVEMLSVIKKYYIMWSHIVIFPNGKFLGMFLYTCFQKREILHSKKTEICPATQAWIRGDIWPQKY